MQVSVLLHTKLQRLAFHLDDILVPFYVAAIHFSALIFISYNLLKNRPNLTMRIIAPNKAHR